MSKQYLFGAVTTTFPSRFRDASYTRRIPYNQEVFVDANRDESLVFEVNELNENVPDENSATHFLKELNKKLYADAEMNIIEPAVQNCQLKNQIPSVAITTAVGKVDISKRRQGREVQNFVKVYLANIRLKDPKYKTDVTITAYQPVSTYSRAGKAADRQSGPSAENMAQILEEIIHNFEVTDWSFFTEEA